MKHTSQTAGHKLSYLVNDYIDLKDVVMTVEKIIADTQAERKKTVLREQCRMSYIPLPDKEALILSIELPETVDLGIIRKYD